MSDVKVSIYQPGSDSDALHHIWEAGLAALHIAYSLPSTKLHSFINTPTARVFVASIDDKPAGFAFTYTIKAGYVDPRYQHLKGCLAALVVHPDYQRRGAGSALLKAAMEYLIPTVRASLSNSTPVPTDAGVQLGSTFPRIFPGLPAIPAFEEARAWFEKRGWKFQDQKSIDLMQNLPSKMDQQQYIDIAQGRGVTFRPATVDDFDKVMVLQKEFDSYTGWPALFPVFMKEGHAHEVHLAIKDGEIIGALLGAMPGSPMHAGVAWPDLISKKCATISCVGVGAAARGTGAGTGLVASAVLDLTSRGADCIFVDWVTLDGFYERVGFNQWEAPYWASTWPVQQ